MTLKEIETIAKNPYFINELKYIGELRRTKDDSAEDNAFYKNRVRMFSLELQNKIMRN